MDKKKILIIEDDTDIRELYTEVLKGAGYEVDTSADGEDGLAKAKNGGWALILLDMMLPKLDGLGILRALRNEPPKVAIGPIILLTNLSHDPVIKMAESLGVEASLIKSDIDPGVLVEKVKGYLGEVANVTGEPKEP